MSSLKRVLAFVAACLSLSLLGEPVRVIFDTDMYTDYDDVGALACLHALADAGEADILAVGCNTWGEGNRSVAVCEIVNAYYGRAELPVGTCRHGGRKGPGDHGYGLVEKFPQWVKHLDGQTAPDAVSVYRRALASAPDGSVVMCSVGFMNNLADLLRSDADDASPLSGRELVAKKCRLWVCMACNYPDGREYNSKWDPPASAYAFANWPTPVIFTDFQYGRHCYAGRAVAELSVEGNPVKEAFKRRLTPRDKVIPLDNAEGREPTWDQVAGHPSWDETAVLIAVRGWERYFDLERGKFEMVGSEGDDVWRPDPRAPGGRVVEKVHRQQVARVLDELMCRPPKCRARRVGTADGAARSGVRPCVRTFPESAFWHAGKGGNLIDVTKAPFFAKGDGVHDDTAALKAALKFAKDNTAPAQDRNGRVGGSPRRDTNWTVYLPRGTYLVSDTVAYGWPAVAMDLTYNWSDVRYIRVETAEAESRLRKKPRKPGMPGLYSAEINWNIRVIGECRETTVLRLKDNAAGFGPGARKPVLSYHLLRQGSNVNYGNFLEGVTIDVGEGNPGAVGVKWSASNYGAIRDVALRGRGAQIGVDMPVYNVCGYFHDLVVDGFRTAFRCAAGHETTLAAEDIVVRAADIAFAAEGDVTGGGSLLNLRHVDCTDVKTNIVVTPGRGARVIVRDCPFAPDTRPALVKAEDAPAMQWPARDEIATPEEFGAIGDGLADDTAAIQRAMDSGKRAVFFTRPAYAIAGTVSIPASVTLVEGMFAGFCRYDTRTEAAMFRVAERASAPLEVRRFYVAGAKLIDHEKERVAVVNDIFVEFPQGRGAATGDGFFFPGEFTRSPLQWYAYRNSDPSVRKKLFAANCVGLCAQAEAGTWNYLENVDLQARAINNERDAAKLDGANKFGLGGSGAYAMKNCRAWIFGAKSEHCRTSVDAIDSTLDLSGFNYLNWNQTDFPESPAIRVTRTTYAIDGFFWKTDPSQPIVLRDTDAAGKVVDRLKEEFHRVDGENGFAINLTSAVKNDSVKK